LLWVRQNRVLGLSTFSEMSQSSAVVLPALMPPWKRTPLPSRAFVVRSKPFQCSIRFPYELLDRVMVFICPTFSRLRSNISSWRSPGRSSGF
jgi:hypothetical protein